jgi:hypothetical protein
VVVACELALEAAHGLDAALAFGFLASEISARLGVEASACNGDDVQCAVELAVAATVQAVTIVAPGRHRNGRHSGDAGKVCVCGEALGSGGLSDQDRRAKRTTARLGEQLRPMRADEVAELPLELLGFAGQLPRQAKSMAGSRHLGSISVWTAPNRSRFLGQLGRGCRQSRSSLTCRAASLRG